MGLMRSIFGKKKKLPKTTSSSDPPPPPSQPRAQPLSRAAVAEELEYVFKKFDANGDGKISSSELGSIMKSLGQPSSEEEIRKMIREVDVNGDGHINFEEFIELNTNGIEPDEILENLKEAFSIFDIDGNGSITAEELHMVLGSLGDKCSMAECRKMIAGVDGDGDGMINFEEFKVMMTGTNK
ncbi:hypothetical protein VNO78_09692 [Psophocarpus tetragonolobus]|uniref:EF-hand domain-containing protein n=1 Tax=Psophocarpus tetragonolobus TaxID=3891 RepID=A0AAN9SWP3_PSOTE